MRPPVRDEGVARSNPATTTINLAEIWIATATNNASAGNTGRQLECRTELFIGPRHHDMMGQTYDAVHIVLDRARLLPDDQFRERNNASHRCCRQEQGRNRHR